MAQDHQQIFFDGDDVLERVLFLHGHTDDSFFFAGTLYNSMEYMLECHLQKIGYDLVLFYNGVQRLYCYTQAMARKRDELFPELCSTTTQRNQMIEDELAAFTVGDEPDSDQDASEVELCLQIDDLEIASFADKVMRRTDVHTAIVFSDGWDLLENTEPAALRTLSYCFRSWYHLSAINRNIAILCFGALTSQHLSECLHHVTSWQFLQDKIISGNTFTKAVKYISIPQEDELLGRLRLEANYRRLPPPERENVITGVKRKLHDLGNSLKGLDDFLHTQPEAVDQLAACVEDDSEALAKLQNTRGWESVARAVERIARNVEVSGTHESAPPETGTVLRMCETLAFLPSGISCNMVLKGNPGTGKTTIARLLGRIFRQLKLLPSGHVVSVARDDLVGRYVGHTAANTRLKIEEAMGGILFIDEAYSLYRVGDRVNSNDFGVEAIDTLIEAMTRQVGAFAVVLAGYPDEMEFMLNANPGFRSRFGQNILTIEDYPPDLLQSIACDYLTQQYRNTGLAFDLALTRASATGNKPLDVFFKGWFAARNRKHFGNARDARNLVDLLVDNALSRGGTTILQEDFPQELRQFFKEADLDLDSVIASLDDIVGQEDVKIRLLNITRRLRLHNRQTSARSERQASPVAPGHYLFYGNPGTGKSTIADKFAQLLGALRITGRFKPTRVTGTVLLQAYQTRGVEGMRRIIEDARGGVLFIDEAHQLVTIPVALQLLLDPMIDLRNELCVILACYEHQMHNLFDVEPGLESRLSGIFHFADYTADELTQIFSKKVTAAGYTCAPGVLEAANAWFQSRLDTDAASHNGRYAEQLLDRAEQHLAERLHDLDDASTDELFQICEEDLV